MFRRIHTSTRSKARRGVLTLEHGKVQTPCFMPIATRGSVKALPFADVKKLGATMVLANTYHLILRPGVEVIQKVKGLHNFTSWTSPILTDSGGYQVFSLSAMRKIAEDGVHFQSHIDGASMFLSPELSLDAQIKFGVDIAMVLDDVAGYPADKHRAREAMERTTRWAERSQAFLKKSRSKKKPRLFAIVQGSTYDDLRRESAETLTSLDFDGYAIGGLAVGEPEDAMYAMTEVVNGILPENKPRYLMGVGTPKNIVESVRRGVDMFDCVLPTRNARHGTLYIERKWKRGRSASAPTAIDYKILRLRNEKYRVSDEPIDSTCSCVTCKTISRAYLRHLLRVQEPTAMYYATVHNLHFYLTMMEELRGMIQKNTL